jgi:hypothetical protein
MADRLDLLLDLPEDLFKYNSYQVQPQTVPSQRPYFIPALRSRNDAIAINDFLCQQMTTFNPQYPAGTEYFPQYPSPPSKTVYPTLSDVDYAQQADLTPSTNLYPQLFDQTPLPSSNYVGIGTRMPYDQTRIVYAGTLTKAPPQRSGSEELVEDLGKMDVDSEAKEGKAKQAPVIIKAEDDEESDKVKAAREKHYELIKKLQKMVQERLLDWPAERKESPIIKKESPVEITVQ